MAGAIKQAELSCGRLGRTTVSEAADRAALHIISCKKLRAVCLDPKGLVTVESEKSCIEDDIVGAYRPELGHFSLWKQIQEDLTHAAELRGIASSRPKYRDRVYAGRKPKKEAA